MQDIVLYKYNPKHNRRYKIQTSKSGYASAGTVCHELSTTNFNPNDGVYTNHVFNYDGEMLTPDYAVVYDEDTDAIKSRWFITECTRLKNSQYSIDLTRDVVADYHTAITGSTAYVKRGSLPKQRPGSETFEVNPMLLQPENISVNQIWHSRQEIRDQTNAGAIVIYVDPKYQGNVNEQIIADKAGDQDMPPMSKYFKGLYGCHVAWNGPVTNYQTSGDTASTFLKQSQGILTGYNKLKEETNHSVSTLSSYQDIAQFPKMHNVAPYDMLIIPCNIRMTATYYDYLTNPNNAHTAQTFTGTISYTRAKSYASIIASSLGPYCYGMQLVPFCPVVNNIHTADRWEIVNNQLQPKGAGINQGFGYDYGMFVVNNNGSPNYVCPVIYASDYCVQFNTYIQRYTNTDTTYSAGRTAITAAGVKRRYLTSKFRICSPTANAQYEFSDADFTSDEGHTGQMQMFLFGTCKPGQSNLAIYPDYDNSYLYHTIQSTTNPTRNTETRGLFCNHGFEIPFINEAWTQYTAQNASYAAIFDNQIKTQETQFDLQRSQQAVAGTLNALSTGLGAGLMTGNAGVGLAVGAASLIGMGADRHYEKKQFENQIASQKIQHNLNLAAIQAAPSTLSGQDTYNAQGEIFPYVDIYLASPNEDTYVDTYLDYYGMAVNTVGTISDYDDNYIQADIIRFPSTFHEDAHMQQRIMEEISQGYYFS